jgi:hypothetical protein
LERLADLERLLRLLRLERLLRLLRLERLLRLLRLEGPEDRRHCSNKSHDLLNTNCSLHKTFFLWIPIKMSYFNCMFFVFFRKMKETVL